MAVATADRELCALHRASCPFPSGLAENDAALTPERLCAACVFLSFCLSVGKEEIGSTHSTTMSSRVSRRKSQLVNPSFVFLLY
jgi:hypothetical protein